MNNKKFLKNLKKNNKFLYIFYYVKTNKNCQFYLLVIIFILYIILRIFCKKKDDFTDNYDNTNDIDDNIDDITFTKKSLKTYSVPTDVKMNESNYNLNYINNSNVGRGIFPPNI